MSPGGGIAEKDHWSKPGGGPAGLDINSNYPYRDEEPQLAAMCADACGAGDLGCRLDFTRHH